MVEKAVRRPAWGWVTPVIILFVVPYGAFKVSEYRHHINHMPAALEVTRVLYSKEENWGSIFFPLPGDNETGILVYGLSGAVANKVATQGRSFFDRPDEWHETPIAEGDDHWPVARLGRKISNYLNRYGFGIPVKPSVEALVDDAISTPGSFYSHGRTGMVIVVPKARRAIYVYAG